MLSSALDLEAQWKPQSWQGGNMSRLSIMMVIMLSLFLTGNTYAQSENKQEDNKNNASITNTNKETENFAGINFGVGLGAIFDIGKHNRVKSASIVNNIVRIDAQEDTTARIFLESHIFFTEGTVANLMKPSFCSDKCGVGPFVAIQPGDDKVIRAIALGIMLGIKREESQDSKASFNLGLGIAVDPQSKVLGDGIQKNKPLPVGETQIRLKEKEQVGILFIFSTSF